MYSLERIDTNNGHVAARVVTSVRFVFRTGTFCHQSNNVRVFACVCVCMCVRACVRACVCVKV